MSHYEIKQFENFFLVNKTHMCRIKCMVKKLDKKSLKITSADGCDT